MPASLTILFSLAGSGFLLVMIGGWYFEHRQGTAKSVGAAAMLIGSAFLIVFLGIYWFLRIRHDVLSWFSK
jgi:hypothetical protein